MDWIKWNLLVLLVTTGKHTDAANNTSSPTSTTAPPTTITAWEEPAAAGANNSLVSSATISSTSPTTTITTHLENPEATVPTTLSLSLTNISSTSATTTNGTSEKPSTITSTTTTSPTTSPIVCSPPAIAHGKVNPDSSSYVPCTSVSFTCNDGYKLSENAHILTCNATGQWNGSAPECTQIECTPPKIAHGGFHPNKAPFLPGTSVSFTCNAGYELSDDAHIYILICNDAGQWNGSAPECTRIVCTPPQIGNGEVATDNSSYVPGTSISFKCKDGYKLSDIYTLTCSGAGEWNGSAPECTQRVCQPVEQIGNGTITSTPPYLPGQNITFNCSVGFRPPGGKERYSCTSSGNWTGDFPECKMISCSRPSAIDNGDYTPKQEYYKYNTSVTYDCKPGYKPDDDMTLTCLLSGNWSAKRPTCSLKRIPYNKTCVYSETEKPCITKNATCLQTEGDEFRCLCTSNKVYLNSSDVRDSCLSKIVYNMTILNLRIRDDSTTERSTVLEWDDNQNFPPFTNLMIVIKDENGTEVQREPAYRSSDPKMKHKELTKLNPGHHYTAVITVHDDRGVPSLTNTTLEFCTRPLPVRTITFENVDLRSFSVKWDYDISSSFTEISISVASVVQMAPAIFVNCPNQQPDTHVCIMDRNDSVTQLRMQNLTPGTAYNISIYTGVCNPKLRSQPSLSSTYTVPSLPEFHIKETGDGLTSSSIVVAWNDTDKSKQFKRWYAIVKDDDSKVVQNKSFENTVPEGRISDLKPATKYTAEFYTTVPDRQSSMSPPHAFYTRPSDVPSVDVKDVHKDNLTVTLKNGAENKDVHFNVLVTSNEGYKNNWNITNGPWSVVVTSLTEATNYSIAVYAVLIKDDGSALLSSDALRTWTYSGPPAPTKIDILSIDTNSLTIKPSTNINVSATITYAVSYAAILATPLDWETISNSSGEIKLNTLSAGTYYTIRVYTKLTQTSRPVTITSDDFLEISTYTIPPAVDSASIRVNSSTSDSLKIQWNTPTEGDIKKYQYQANFTCVSPNGDRDTIRRESNETKDDTTSARGLDPGTSCVVDLQVLVGSRSSEISHKVLRQKTTEKAPGKVREISTYDVSSTALSVRWKDPSERNGVIRGYKIIIPQYKQNTCEPGSPWSNDDVECLRKVLFTCEDCPPSGDPTTSQIPLPDRDAKYCDDTLRRSYNSKAEFNYTVTDLHPYMNYSIQIIAYTFEYGSYDSHIVLTTQTPPGPPTNIAVNPNSSSTITAHWNKPACGQRNGPLGDYRLSYTYRNTTICTDYQGSANITVTKTVQNINQLSRPLTGLSANWKYHISVQASNGGVYGAVGNADPVTTLEARPEAVRDVKIGEITSSSVPIFWTQPCLPRGVITNYTIYVNNTDQANNVSAYFSGSATIINATGLLPYRNYTIVIWASTAIGQGDPSAQLQTQTGVGVPYAPVNVVGDAIGFNEVQVYWDTTFFTGPTSFIAFASSNTSQRCSGADYYTRQCVITGLTPYTNYTFIVIAVTTAGNTRSSESEVVLTKQSVPGIVTMVTVKPEPDVTKKRSVIVKWGPPARDNRHGRIIGYAINIKHDANSEINISCSINSTDGSDSICSLKMGIVCSTVDVARPRELNSLTCLITDITTGNYTVKVLALTNIGKGPPTPKAAYVEPGAPLSLVRGPDQPPLVQHGSVGVDDPKRQIAVQFPRDVICNEDNGKPTSWGLVVADDTMATDLSTYICPLIDINNPSSFTWEIGVSKSEVGTNPCLNRGSAEVQTGSTQPRVWIRLVPDTPFTGSKNKFLQAAKTRYRTWFDVEGSDHMAPYIATVDNWNPCILQKGSRKRRSTDEVPVPFVVGSSGKCSGVPHSSRCNGELTPDKSYRVKAFVCTDGGCTETSYSSPITTDKLVPVAMIAGIVAAVIVVIIVVVVILLMKRRQMLCFRKTIDEEVSTHRSEPPVSGSEMKAISSKSSRFKPGPVKLADFPEFVDKLYKDSHLLFSDSYTMLKEEARVHPLTAAESQKNRPKNRYTNILAYDHSRVKLLPVDDDEDSDYINANYIPGYTSKREYIACQGPLVATFNDFWRMVWEQNVDTIVMLTKLVEKGRHKCDKYWPELNEPVYFGDLVVSVQSESHLSDYTIRVMEVKLKTSRRVVRQFCYLKWPDMGCPDQPLMLLDFVKSVKEYTKAGAKVETGPVIVHCSAGVGRTGTFIAVDYLLQYIKDHDDIDIYRLVLDMRNHRCNMVQTEDQFVYIHECMKEFITLGDEDDEEDDEPIYVNDPAGGENVYENTAFTADM